MKGRRRKETGKEKGRDEKGMKGQGRTKSNQLTNQVKES